MTTLTFKSFGGIFPRVPRSLLPDNAAAEAKNCDFAYGELRALKAPFLLTTLAANIGSLYTEDGIRFYTWLTDVDAVKSPTIGDTFQRVYYTNGTDFRVTTSANMTINGGAPTSSYRVGVPKPTVAPTLVVAGTVLPSDLSLSATFHYEFAGVKYQEGSVALETITAGKKYRFTPPARVSGSSGSSSVSGDEAITIRAMVPGSAFNPMTVLVTGPSSLLVVDPKTSGYSAGQTFSGVTTVEASDGSVFQVNDLWMLTKYASVNESGASSTSTTPQPGTTGTPEQAFVAIYLVGTSSTTQEEAFKGYSDNSAFVESGQKVKITLTLDKDNAGKYFIALDFGTGANDEDETRAYTYTLVNTYSEEGAPAPPATITSKLFDRINVGATLPANTDYAPIKAIRVYRSAAGTSTDDYYFVTEFPCLGMNPGVITIVDDKKAAELNEPIRSTYWLPPEVTLKGLRALPNGILMGWHKNEVRFSEAYRPHAWSPNNVLTFPHNVVAGEVHGSGAVICTTAEPHVISGVSPDGMSQRKANIEQACVAKNAIVNVSGSVVYGSHDGLVMVGGGIASLAASSRFFTREKWRELYGDHLSYLRFAAHDGHLIGYFTNGGAAPFVIRLDEATGTMTELQGLSTIASSFLLPTTDGLYIGVGSQVQQWAGGAAMSARWRSKEFVLPKPKNFGAALAVVEPGASFTIRVYTDGTLRHAKSVSSTTYFRLPSGFKSTRWQIEVEGTGTLRELYIAETMNELAAT